MSMSEPLVSVVIPAYNASRFIRRTLDSVRNQTYSELEIIVVDDGSTDDTARLVADFARLDDRLRLVSTENRGVAAARNTGIALSKGHFVAFLDADDLWHPTKIEKQVSALARRSEDWGGVYTLFHGIDEQDRLLSPMGVRGISSGYIYARHLVLRSVGNGSALMVRRNILLEIGGFDPSYAAAGIGGCEDADLELRLVEKYKMDVVPERLVGYRTYSGNMSSNNVRMGLSVIEAVKRSILRTDIADSCVARMALGTAYVYALGVFRRAGDKSLMRRAAIELIRTDPVALIEFALKVLRLNVAPAPPLPEARHYYDVALETEKPVRENFLWRHRLSRLAKEDGWREMSLLNSERYRDLETECEA